MAKLFGFSIEDSQNKSTSIVSPVPKNNEDGVDNYVASGFYGQYVDIEGAYRNEHELIRRYRDMALHPEVDKACLLYTSPSPRDATLSRMPSSA